MASKPKAVRKSVAFDESDADQALLDAIETELFQKQYESFSDLCKVALHQFLLSREPTQSVILFMELERQMVELQSKFAQFEAGDYLQTLAQVDTLAAQVRQLNDRIQQLEGTASVPSGAELLKATKSKPELDPEPLPEPAPPAVDPLLNRLGPLLEDF